MEVVILPSLSIVQGLEFYQEYAFQDNDGPIDLSDWEVSFALSSRPFDAPFHQQDIAAGADGIVRVAIAADETRGFEALPRIGGAPSAMFQIKLIAPAPDVSQVWQGPAIIAGVLQ
jgi:hypothetical protein